MYEEFFGLTEKPFSIQPDPSFLYWGRGHRLAYAMLEYGVLNRAGISVITGEVGCGKTTLVHRLLDNLSETHTVALLSNIQQGRGDLLSWVLMGFGKPFAGKSHVELFADLQNFFIAEYSKGRRVVLIIDEAQNLSVDMLEELRMLSNINAGKDQLLQLILVGQPQLKDLLNRPDMLQLAQRVGADFHLTPLSREEVASYLETRLSIAGAKRRIFTERAIDLIAEQSRGVPRVINIIADTSLVYAFSAQETNVGSETIANVVRDKSDYGVFGLASDVAMPALKERQAEGPDAFVAAPPVETEAPTADVVQREPMRVVASGGALRAAPAAGDDLPRMAVAAKRPRPVVAPEATPRPRNEIPTAPQRPVSADFSEPPPATRAPIPAPSPNPPPQAEPTKALVIGVVVTGATAPAAALSSAKGVGPVVFVAPASDAASIANAREAGAQVVEIADRALSPGRARNAGYRQLKKLDPDLAYVQFLDAGSQLDPAWLEEAARFMDRRPEVAAIDGPVTDVFRRTSAFDAACLQPAARAGEVQHTGSTALLRASAFEAAGGFRGDLAVNEMQDLCIRLRRRGAHVWRLDRVMSVREHVRMGFSGWRRRAIASGYEYAHGAALHGAPPERLYAAAQLRAIFWGAIFPLFIVVAAIGGGVLAAAFAPMINAYAAAGGVLAFGLLAYVAKTVIIAIRHGVLKGRSWAYGVLASFGHIPEFLGAWRYYRGKPRPASHAAD